LGLVDCVYLLSCSFFSILTYFFAFLIRLLPRSMMRFYLLLDDPALVHTLKKLSSIHRAAGRIDDAADFLARALGVVRGAQGSRHRDAASLANALGELRFKQVLL